MDRLRQRRTWPKLAFPRFPKNYCQCLESLDLLAPPYLAYFCQKMSRIRAKINADKGMFRPDRDLAVTNWLPLVSHICSFATKQFRVSAPNLILKKEEIPTELEILLEKWKESKGERS